MTRSDGLPGPGERCVLVENLRLSLYIGVLEREKGARQEVSVSIRMFVADAGRNVADDLADHVSYADIVEALQRRAAAGAHVNLVETLAEEVMELALADPRVAHAIVEVRKTEIIPQADAVGVVLHRLRPAPSR